MADSIVVIQCAASKHQAAGRLKSSDGRNVMFVAEPDEAPATPGCVYARPDDRADTGFSWRKELRRYNQEQAAYNPFGLLPAWRLYQRSIYELLYRKFGPDNLYILSAGWGLIRSDFLTAAYDITFSKATKVEKYKRRGGNRDIWNDFHMLSDDTAKPVVFFGGKDYVSLFCALTDQVKSPRHVIYNAIKPPDAPGCRLHRFDTSARTTWYYKAAREFAEGRMDL